MNLTTRATLTHAQFTKIMVEFNAVFGPWPTLMNLELLRFEKAGFELHPRRLLQDKPIILSRMA
jgi:hypothetical protein